MLVLTTALTFDSGTWYLTKSGLLVELPRHQHRNCSAKLHLTTET